MDENDAAVYKAAELFVDSEIDLDVIQRSVSQMLEAFGENPEREGLVKTPERVARMFEELLAGYRTDPIAMVNDALFDVDYDEMVIVRDIEFYSLCEHHMLPFFGRCHIGYIAENKIIGVSKLARIVDSFARRLQVQERLTAQIARETMLVTKAEGVGVVMECRHLCTMMRGVEKQNSIMTTSSVLGSFHHDAATRAEFLNLIGRHSS